jgi:ribonuclease HI
MITELYIASGLIGSNPSAIGATYANRLIGDAGTCHDRSGVLPSWKIEFTAVVTNNQAEMWAMLEGLRRLPETFSGTIYSRNQVTLGRIFSGWKWTNIPSWIHQIYRVQRKRLLNWGEIKYVLVDAKNEHYKWCEQACHQAGDGYMATIGANIPSTLELENVV